MSSQWPPKINTAFTLHFTLFKNDGTIVANPGTYTKKVWIDGGGVADIAAAVTEIDTTYGRCSVVLAAGEMNGDRIDVHITDDTAGTVPFTCTLYTTANTQDELGTAITAIDDYIDTEIGALTTELAKVPKSDSTVSWNATALGDINAQVDLALNTAIPGGPTADSINERIATMDGTGVNVASQSNIDFGALQKASLNAATPASVGTVTGNVDGSVGSVTGAVGSVTGAVGSVTGAVGSVTAGVTVSDKTGYSLSTAGILAIWHQLTSAVVTASTIGKLIVDYLDAAISSRNATTPPTVTAIRQEMDSNSTQLALIVADTNELQTDWANGGRLDLLLDAANAPTAAAVADAVLDEALSGHAIVGSAGAALSAAGASGDPWATALPGSYASGTAGNIIGNIVSAVWAWASRVLTATAAETTATVSGSDINIQRGDSLSISLTGLGNISARTKLWFTVKSGDGPDTDAIIDIEETSGLVRLNGAAGTAIQGDITVDDATAGDITITMDEVATAQLPITSGLDYDVQMLTATSVQTLTSGLVTISKDVKRATS